MTVMIIIIIISLDKDACNNVSVHVCACVLLDPECLRHVIIITLTLSAPVIISIIIIIIIIIFSSVTVWPDFKSHKRRQVYMRSGDSSLQFVTAFFTIIVVAWSIGQPQEFISHTTHTHTLSDTGWLLSSVDP